MAKIAILNGNPEPANQSFETYLTRLEQSLVDAGHQPTRLNLREMDIRYCVGCWGCWVKTPGECLSKDESSIVCRTVINNDWTLFCSPIIMGFPSALLKKTVDKLIPLVHPYIMIFNDECHHRPRYDKYPRMGLLLEKTPGTDDEDIAIISDIFNRTAINIKTSLVFTHLITEPIMEVVNEIDHL